jgi:23S rRNA pseudouridine2605 synthase
MAKDRRERLHKTMASAGVASRRKSEEIILQGRVTVNGKVVTELGTKVDPRSDDIRVDGQRIQTKSYIYIMLNKPRGVLSVMEDERGRSALGDLVSAPERLYPVGRLDATSEGLILLTNDGELANLLTHPRYMHEKEYIALVNGRPSEKTLQAWQRGVLIDDKLTASAQISVIRTVQDSTLLRIEMREGRKRQIRRVAALLGHPVRELKRMRLGPLQLGSLEPGQWRYLTAKEISELESLKRQDKNNKKRSPRQQKRKR